LYFLNNQGDLGYITADSMRAAKEIFPQVNDRKLLKLHPDFILQIEGFLRDIGEIPAAYLRQDRVTDIELGYILAPDEEQHRSASTFIFHKHVLETLRRDEQALYQTGMKVPSRRLGAVQHSGVRSVHQGFADLLYHKNIFGIYRYFPVLVKLPEQDPEFGSDMAPLRVINLKWRETGDEVEAAAEFSLYPTVFSILRANMVKRGAIVH